MRKLVGVAIIAAFLVLLSYFVLADSHEPWRPGQGGGGGGAIVPKERGIPIPPPGNNTDNVQSVPGSPVSAGGTVAPTKSPSENTDVYDTFTAPSAVATTAERGPTPSLDSSTSQVGSEESTKPAASQNQSKSSNQSNDSAAAKPNVPQEPKPSFFVAVRNFFKRLFG